MFCRAPPDSEETGVKTEQTSLPRDACKKKNSRCRVVESKCVRTHFSLSSAQDVTVTIFNARDVLKTPLGGGCARERSKEDLADRR